MLAFDPKETVEISLTTDKAKPAESRPTFIVKYLTYGQSIQYAKLVRAAGDEPDDDKAVGMIRDAFKLALVDWKNVGREFNSESITDILTGAECWELAYEIPNQIRVTQLEKKRSLLQSPTDTEKSVKSAEGESATMNPPPTPQ